MVFVGLIYFVNFEGIWGIEHCDCLNYDEWLIYAKSCLEFNVANSRKFAGIYKKKFKNKCSFNFAQLC